MKFAMPSSLRIVGGAFFIAGGTFIGGMKSLPAELYVVLLRGRLLSSVVAPSLVVRLPPRSHFSPKLAHRCRSVLKIAKEKKMLLRHTSTFLLLERLVLLDDLALTLQLHHQGTFTLCPFRAGAEVPQYTASKSFREASV